MATTVLDAPEVSIIPQGGFGFPLDVVDNTFNLQLDEGQAPYLQAGALITRPDDETYALLEPNKRTPISITVQVGAIVPLTSTMYVFERQLDPEADVVALKFVSRENDLQTYSPSSDVNLIAYQSSVRTLCAQVIARATGVSSTPTLVSGAADQTFRTFTEAENLFPNPDSASAAGFTAYSSSGSATTYVTVATVSSGTGAQAPYGQGIRTTAKATLTYMDVRYPSTASVPISASAGTQYTASVATRASSGLTNGTLYIQFADSAGTVLQTYSKSYTNMTANYSTSVRMSVTGVAPPGTSTIGLVLRTTGSITSGAVLDGAQWMVLEGNGQDPNAAAGTLHPYFSGSTADTADYHYAWTGDANVSQSTRTPIVERTPDNLLWSPGVSADEFLKPVLDAVGLRLFLREDGVWCLADNGYSVAGQLTIQYGSNLYEGSELLSLGETDADGFPMNADAVILRYSWTDAITGQERTATDTATTTSYKRPYVLEIDQPYPGPGQAKFLLQRLQARKYRIDANVRPDWTARPGMTALVSLANRPAQTGYVQALEFDLASGRMNVTTKDLITALSGSIGKAPIDQTIGSVSGTIAAYTN